MCNLYHIKCENTLQKQAILDFYENGSSLKMPKMAIGCHSNGSAHFEEKTLIRQIIHETESSDQIS